MNFLKNIDFINHDGVNRGMINDFMRNQFYDNIFKDCVRNKHCIDIGFGTGLLSLLALKHGAKSVVAYEFDPNRYALGQLIIEQLNLQDCIQLINKKFNYLDYAQYPTVDTVFSETVNGNLWQEGLMYSLPRTPGIDFLPGQYFLEIWACEIPMIFAQGLAHPRSNQGFTAGVDLRTDFVALINHLGFPNHQPIDPLDLAPITKIDSGQDTEWGWIPYMRLAMNNADCVAGYTVNATAQTLCWFNGSSFAMDWALTNIEFSIDVSPWQNSAALIVPRVGMRHGDCILYLDTGHWGPTHAPVVLNHAHGHLKVSHNLYTGELTFTLAQ